jgi:hypothetical protein
MDQVVKNDFAHYNKWLTSQYKHQNNNILNEAFSSNWKQNNIHTWKHK